MFFLQDKILDSHFNNPRKKKKKNKQKQKCMIINWHSEKAQLYDCNL